MVDYNYLVIVGIILSALLIFYSKKKKPVSIVDIICYPIKSCAGIHLAKAEIIHFGIKDDRVWAILLENKVISQLDEPKLVKLQPSFKYTLTGEQSHLMLSYPGTPDFYLPLSEKSNFFKDFKLENAEGKYLDEGDSVSEWLFGVLGKKYRLGKIIKFRNIEKINDFKGKNLNGQELSFASEGQLLFVNKNSLEDFVENLSATVREKVSIQCFRPNVVVKNLRPYEEDCWENFEINGIKFEGVKKCDRCRMITIDQDTAEMDSNCEPLTTLRKVHGHGLKAFFGLLAIRHNNGTIRLGDKVRILSKINR